MNIQPSFNAAELSAFVQTKGWVQVVEAAKGGLYVFNHPDFRPQQLVFAIDEQFADYDETLLRAAARLAQIYDWQTSEAIRKIEESNHDVVVSRVPDGSRHLSTVSFLYALQVMEAQRQLLLSGAAANGKRQTHYAKVLAGDGKRMLEAARFRQTEEGSFIFKASCRLYEFEGQNNPSLFSATDEPITAPFVRRAMVNIGGGLQDLVRSIQTRQEDKFVADVIENGASTVSSNLCEAVAELRDREHPHPIELSINWSPLLAPPAGAPREPILIVPDYFPVIEDIGKALQPTKKPARDRYIATVDELRGTFNDLGQREGRVLISLLTANQQSIDQPIKVRVTLDAPKYEEAVAIHKTQKVVARVTGTIKPSQRQPYEFDLDSFDIINV